MTKGWKRSRFVSILGDIGVDVCVCVCGGGGGGGTLLESNTVSSVTLNHFIFPPEPIKLLQSHNLTLDDVVSFEYAPINDMPHLPHLVRGVW